MKWSICLPSYDNFTEVYFTVQSLRLHHDLKDCEIIVVDNFGDKILEGFCREKGAGVVRYEKYTDITGVSAAKNRAIALAKGEFILCMDSHILLRAGALDGSPWGDDLVQGPCLFNNLLDYAFEWLPVWRRQMWGIWAPSIMSPETFASLPEEQRIKAEEKIKKGELKIQPLPTEPFEIWATGAGFFACRRDSWLGFNPKFRAFGGETGYIQEKYRKAGRKVWCDPRMVWVHFFSNGGRKVPFPCPKTARVRNYLLGFNELGLDTSEMETHFGPILMKQVREGLEKEKTETAALVPQEVR
jgi:glycosyltransferase involved in cell wall biosynthesis